MPPAAIRRGPRACAAACVLAAGLALAGPSSATPLPAGRPLVLSGAPLDPVLDRMPAGVRTALDWLAERLGYVMGLACAAPIAALLFWGFIIVPRRLDRWLDGLERLRLGPEGWGFSCGDLSRPEVMDEVPRVADTVSAALS